MSSAEIPSTPAPFEAHISGSSKPPAWTLQGFRDDGQDETGRQPPPLPPSPAINDSLSSPRSPTPAGMTSPQEFRFTKELGSGSWSTVMEAVHARTDKRYAVKILSKAQLIKQKKAKYANVEKDALVKLSGSHPGIVKMYAAFQDDTSLYFVLDLAPHGDLADLVKTYGSLSLPCSRWYTAQIVDAVLWMHSKGIMHRDMKPENVLLDTDMRVKLTDYGSAYIASDGDLSPRSSTFVGSAAYVSPELLDRVSKSTSNSSDIWAIGCTLFFMVVGTPPFAAINDYQSFRKIEALDYTFPKGFYGNARDLVQHLLVLDPFDRLGIEPKSSPAKLREHPFFVGADGEKGSVRWNTLWKDPPVPPETGITTPAPQAAVEDDDDDIWGSVVHEFSRVGLHPPNGGSLSPTNFLPSGPPVDVPPDAVSCEVVETVHPDERGPVECVEEPAVCDYTDDPILKANDWSHIVSPGESVRHVALAKTPLRKGLLKQNRPCALLLTTLPRVACVVIDDRDKQPKQPLDVKHSFVFLGTGDSPSSRKGDKHEAVTSCRTDGERRRLFLQTSEKEYWYEFAEPKQLVGWQREIETLIQPTKRS